VPSSLEAMVERCHSALGQIVRGNAEPWADLLSTEPDVSLGNPFGPFVLGFENVMSAARGAADRYRDGELIGFDRVATYETADLACVVEVERFRARVGDSPDIVPVSLRVTSLYRAESGEWKVAHRHADPITSPRQASSVVTAGP
jgi:ketosteroid isomerase-like protein